MWHQFVAIASVACTFAIYATGRVVPLTAMDLTFVAFCFVVVIFGLIALSDFPAYVLACFVAAHVASIPVFVVDDEASLPGRSAALLLGAIVLRPHSWREAADYVRAPRPAGELSPELGG